MWIFLKSTNGSRIYVTLLHNIWNDGSFLMCRRCRRFVCVSDSAEFLQYIYKVTQQGFLWGSINIARVKVTQVSFKKLAHFNKEQVATHVTDFRVFEWVCGNDRRLPISVA